MDPYQIQIRNCSIGMIDERSIRSGEYNSTIPFNKKYIFAFRQGFQ